MPSNYKIKNHMGSAGKGKGEEEEEAVSGLECLKKEMIIDKEGPDEEDYSMDSDQQNCSTGCTSPSSSSSSSSLNGPLFQLSDLMAQLPIKRGLSRYYEGKSQSHTSLASVKCVEDLVKKKMKMKMRWCRSHGCFSPKATISKKGSSTPYMLRF